MRARPGDEREHGQATVELALALPILAFVMAAIVEVAMIAADQTRLWHAAREAARAAVVDADSAEARAAVERSGLDGIEMKVTPRAELRRQGEPLTVRLAYHPPGRVPVVGDLLGLVELTAQATMRIEQP